MRLYGSGLSLRGIAVSVKVWEWKHELDADDWCA